MGTPIEPVDDSVQGNVPDQDNSPGPNPAWNDVLSILPEQFHSVVTPHFQKWDQSAQSRIEAANNSLREFESYKPFVEHGITNDEIEQGLRLMYEINNNPQNVYNALANAYNFNQTPEVSEEDDDTPEGYEDPRYSELQQGLELVSKIVLNDAQAKQAAQDDYELDQELNKLKEEHGDYDERYVLAMMQNGMSGAEAVEAFKQLQSSFNQSRPFAPTLLGNSAGGAGLPSNAIDPTKLSGKETRNLVTQMLEQAAKQS